MIFHFTPYYRKKWGISQNINGSRNVRSKTHPMFWVCCERKEMAQEYEDLYEFDRLMYHEMAHHDEDIDNERTNILAQESVHTVDYKLKQIQHYHLMVDYRYLQLRKRIDALSAKVIKFIQRVLR